MCQCAQNNFNLPAGYQCASETFDTSRPIVSFLAIQDQYFIFYMNSRAILQARWIPEVKGRKIFHRHRHSPPWDESNMWTTLPRLAWEKHPSSWLIISLHNLVLFKSTTQPREVVQTDLVWALVITCLMIERNQFLNREYRTLFWKFKVHLREPNTQTTSISMKFIPSCQLLYFTPAGKFSWKK